MNDRNPADFRGLRNAPRSKRGQSPPIRLDFDTFCVTYGRRVFRLLGDLDQTWQSSIPENKQSTKQTIRMSRGHAGCPEKPPNTSHRHSAHRRAVVAMALRRPCGSMAGLPGSVGWVTRILHSHRPSTAKTNLQLPFLHFSVQTPTWVDGAPVSNHWQESRCHRGSQGKLDELGACRSAQLSTRSMLQAPDVKPSQSLASLRYIPE